MPRSPFQGNFQPNLRPTVVTAPDALVFINGEQDVLGCPSCKRKFDLSKYITQLQVNLDIDSVPGSASINVSIPRHIVDDFFIDGVPVISPMMEVEIYAKGFFLLEGIPQYYPIFWGIITEVSDSYSAGEHTVTINCADILKWWDICRMNVNPAFLGSDPQLGKSTFGSILFGTNPYDMIFTLAQMAFGDVIVATGSLASLVQEEKQKQTFSAALSDIMAYWSSRFSKIRSNLLLYGVSGAAFRGDSLYERYQSGRLGKVKNFISSAIRNATPGGSSQFTFDPADENVTAFRTDYGSLGEGVTNLWQNDYQTKLEIANACKEAIGFEFYMDVTGDIVFKPPFYNLDILSNKPVSWIQDIDIIDWDFSESEAEVVTQLTIQGGYFGNKDYGAPAELTPYTSVTDYHLLRKYGWRSQPYNSEFLGDNQQRMFFHGLDVLDRINSRRHTATITIPFRPELRLGFPIYIAPKDQVWYIKGINHNIAFGGRATTTLTLTAKRSKFIGIRGISTLKVKGKDPFGKGKPQEAASISAVTNSSYELNLGDAGTVPAINLNPEDPNSLSAYEPVILRHPKTGRIMGYPNVVMVYSRPYDPKEGYSNVTGAKAPGTNAQVPKKDRARVAKNQEINQREMAEEIVDRTVQLQNLYAHNRFTYGLNSAGVFVYAHDQSRYITQMSLIPEKNIKVVQDGATVKLLDSQPGIKSPTTMIRPVSDERGFELIGHYRYGRGVSLRDGSLIQSAKEGKANKRLGDANHTNVGEVQLALSGGLFASLTAQSQGLTTRAAGQVNPADTIARLQPEDLQTGATLLPNNTSSAQFSDVKQNFVDVAPLGSMEQKGVPTSVEASQLSRALTLAEMTVKFQGTPGMDQCECMIGRADLAFINYGYQTKKIIRPSSPATTDEVDFDAALASFDEAKQAASPQAEIQAITNEANTVPRMASVKNSDVIDRVESYLWNLYKALDDSHQPHENALRGDLNGVELSGDPLPTVFPSSNDQSEAGVAPPFSALNRAALGDPVATAMQGRSATQNIEQKFKNFGDDLRKSTKAKKLGTELTNLRSKADRLRRRLSQVGGAGNTDNTNDLQAELDKTLQQIALMEGELAQLTG